MIAWSDPAAIVNPITLHFRFVPPFESDFIYEITFGHHASPVTKLEVRVKPDILQKAYNAFEESDDREAGFQFITTVMDIKDPGKGGQKE